MNPNELSIVRQVLFYLSCQRDGRQGRRFGFDGRQLYEMALEACGTDAYGERITVHEFNDSIAYLLANRFINFTPRRTRYYITDEGEARLETITEAVCR